MEYVSLGGNCAPCYQLRKYNLYKNSMPFDWCKLSIDKLIHVLNNKFENYSDILIKKFQKIFLFYIFKN